MRPTDWKLLPTTLVGRVFALYLFTWLVCVGVGIPLFLRSEFNERLDSIQQQSVMMVELAAQVVGENAVIGDYDTMQRVLDTTTSNSLFSLVQYIDLAGGRIQSRSTSKPPGSTLANWIEPNIKARLLPVNRSITVGGKDYGILRLHYETRTLANALHDFAIVSALTGLLSFVMGIVLIWFPLRRWLRPLTKASIAGPSAGMIEVTPAVLDSAPAEFHQILRTVASTAGQLRAELDQKETILQSLLMLTNKLRDGRKPPTTDNPINNLENAVAAIGMLVEERAATDAALLNAKQAAEQANQAKTVFLAAISHDIRTPMNGILALANVLHSDRDLEEEKRSIAGTIFRSAKSLLTLLNDVLDISQIESGKMEMRAAEFDVDELIDDCAATYRQAAGNNGVQIEITNKCGARFVSDPPRVLQMLSNLVSNAIKFARQGKVRIGVVIADEPDHQRWMTISVKDDGPGISLEQQKKLFQPFSQLQQTRSAQHGSGLGLSIVRKLAELLGGEAAVTSTPGNGAIFHFRIPCMNLPAFAAPAAAMATTRAGANLQREALIGRKIMVVDDTPANLFVLDVLLKKLGCEVWAFDNAHKALSFFTSNQPIDIVLMDLQMPDLDGVTATQQLRKWEQACGKHRTPILAVTAAAFGDDRDACLRAGMDGFLAKPIMIEPLQEALLEYNAPVAGNVLTCVQKSLQ